MGFLTDMNSTELRLWVATQIMAAQVSTSEEWNVCVDDALDTAELLIRRNLAYVPPTER